MDKKIKDMVAVEIYSLLLRSEKSIPLDGKYLVVEFSKKDGKIDRISLEIERKEGDNILSVDIEGVKDGRDTFWRIREELENTELNIDTRYYEKVGNAYDWVWSGADEEQ